MIPRKPVSKGSMSSYRNRVVKSKRLIDWERDVGWLVKSKIPAGWSPVDCGVRVSVDFQFKWPKRMPAGFEDSWRPRKVIPDIDKLARALLDALTGVVWVDDKQVVELRAVKNYDQQDRLVVQIVGVDGCWPECETHKKV